MRSEAISAMKYKNKVIAFILLAVVALFGTTGCFETSTKPVRGNVTGKVYDSNGKALHRAKVTVYGTSMLAETDELGKYVLNGIEPGQAKLTATYNEKSVVRVVEVKRGETIEGFDLTFAVIDGLPPVITGVTVASITENIAVINWVTNELANSIVDYATGPVGLGIYNMCASDTGMVTEHSLTLENLLPGQIYHFRVRAIDFEKNEGMSSDYQFITEKGDAPAMPLNFAAEVAPEQEKLSLSWQPNTESDLAGYNLYRSESMNSNYSKVASIDSQNTGYIDEGLRVASKYYYKLSAIDTAGNESVHTQPVSALTPGILVDNRVWTKQNSPYIVKGDIRIRSGATLTIEPGVEVRFTQADMIPDTQGASMTSLIVQGALYAVGTEQNKIVFTSAEDAPRKGCWDGIQYIGTTNAQNIMRYASIMFADTGIKSVDSSPSIENTVFGSCAIGLNIGLSTAMNVRYNTIQDCQIGIISAGSNIRNNLLLDNELGVALLGGDYFEYNTVDCLIGVQVDFGSPTIKNNIIARTSTVKGIYGISQSSADATPQISYNDVYNFTIPYNDVTTATDTFNIDADPLFVGGHPYNYRLQSSSPCLTADENGGELGRYHEQQ